MWFAINSGVNIAYLHVFLEKNSTVLSKFDERQQLLTQQNLLIQKKLKGCIKDCSLWKAYPDLNLRKKIGNFFRCLVDLNSKRKKQIACRVNLDVLLKIYFSRFKPKQFPLENSVFFFYKNTDKTGVFWEREYLWDIAAQPKNISRLKKH